MSHRLVEMRRMTGTITVNTGLHIGGSQETMEISGLDNPIIRNPANGEPFIPGSSLKGRMRSLAEWYFQELPTNGDGASPNPEARTARVFGIPAQSDLQRGPTRLIVRDALLSSESREKFMAGQPITEVKSENSIDRLTSMANPRPMERVLPDVKFDCEMVYRVIDVDDDGGETDQRLFNEVLLVALSLLQSDALGGGVSRGNGKVELSLSLNGRKLDLPELSFATQ